MKPIASVHKWLFATLVALALSAHVPVATAANDVPPIMPNAAPGAEVDLAGEQDALSADGEDMAPPHNMGDAGDEDEGLDAFDIQQIDQAHQPQ